MTCVTRVPDIASVQGALTKITSKRVFVNVGTSKKHEVLELCDTNLTTNGLNVSSLGLLFGS